MCLVFPWYRSSLPRRTISITFLASIIKDDCLSRWRDIDGYVVYSCDNGGVVYGSIAACCFCQKEKSFPFFYCRFCQACVQKVLRFWLSVSEHSTFLALQSFSGEKFSVVEVTIIWDYPTRRIEVFNPIAKHSVCRSLTFPLVHFCRYWNQRKPKHWKNK